MNEKIIKNAKPHFLEITDVIGDKTVINLDNVNYLRVDVDTIRILFKNDPNEHYLSGYNSETLELVNKTHF